MTHIEPGSLAQKLAIGLMSGTSLDGIDGVLVRFGGQGMHCLANATLGIPAGLREELLALNSTGPDELRRAALAGNQLARLYAELVQTLLSRARVAPTEVAVIGCHGQTVRHQPAEGYTVQLVNAALLSELTGIASAVDFRSRDVAAGGQGAPLVPAFHQAVFSDPRRARAVINIGGFSNISILIPGETPRGSDCGPGNALLDGWIHRHRGEPFDRDGQWASSGQVDAALLADLLLHPFFLRAPPRSTGRDEFHLAWLDQRLAGREIPPEDVQRTLLEFTARAIAAAVHEQPASVEEVFLCGGGAFNSTLCRRIAALLHPTPVIGTRTLGVPENQVEALAFAWLGARLLAGLPGNIPDVTGARGLRVLGALYPA